MSDSKVIHRNWVAVATPALFFAVFLALMGPFATNELSPIHRIAYWVGLVVVGAAVRESVWAAIGRRRGWPPVAMVVLITSLMIPLVGLANTILFHDAYTFAEVSKTVPGVATVSFSYESLVRFWRRPSPAALHSNAAIPRELAKALPYHLKQAALRAVSAEDHYVRVHTDKGSALVRYRFDDALDVLSQIEGAQTHRSWWVHEKAVIGLGLVKGRPVVRIDGGVIVPVSRTYEAVVKAKYS